MKKIASNYIFMPGFPLIRNGYIEWEKGEFLRVVHTDGLLQELPGLEFYGGLLVSSRVQELVRFWTPGMQILPEIERLYHSLHDPLDGLSLIAGIDYKEFRWEKRATIELLNLN